MGEKRADYAPTALPVEGAWIRSVAPGSPADDAGIRPGMRIDRVAGVIPTDIISWMWEASEGEVEVEVYDPSDGTTSVATLWREPGQDWGIDFTDVLFDGIHTCRNACVFCFMSMLPAEMRDTLYLRDDDYRLSFLQGNFVTLTNLSRSDVDRIVACQLEPMNFSLHAITPEVRRSMLGANERRGIEVAEELSKAGIEIHAQIVLCPGLNDADELVRTLDWVEAHPNMTSLAIVPLGYTRFSRRFTHSFSDDVAASRAVVELVSGYQARARESLGITRFQLADEFYLDAHMEVPPAVAYDGYPQFYDGIGMLRSFIDDSDEIARTDSGLIERCADGFSASQLSAVVVCGEAAQGVVGRLVDMTPLAGIARVQAVRNDFFGGNVDVTGLIVACDLLAQLPSDLSRTVVVLPEVMFNSDGLTLDGVSSDEVSRRIRGRGGRCIVCETSPRGLVDAMASAVGDMA